MANPVTPLTPEEYEKGKVSEAHEGYIHRSLVAVDIAVNVVVFDGLQDETISSHAARLAYNEKSGFMHEVGLVVSKGLDAIQKNHGAQAIEADEQRGLNIAKVEESTGVLPK